MIFFRCFLLFSLFVISCNDEEERFETINKLRTIGVIVDKPVIENPASIATPSQINLTAVVAIPKDQTITNLSSFVDEGAAFSLQAKVEVDSNSEDRKIHNAFDIVEFKASVDIFSFPLDKIEAFNGNLKQRYGLLVETGSEVENIVGDVVVVAPGAEALTWTAPSLVEIRAPLDGAEIVGQSEITLQAELTKTTDEIVKVLWFVSSGKVKNVGNKNTVWEDFDSGPQTVVFAVFPRKSKKFSYKVVDVTIR